MSINAQKESEVIFLKKRLAKLSKHISTYKKDYCAKIALTKTVYKIKATNKYIAIQENKLKKNTS